MFGKLFVLIQRNKHHIVLILLILISLILIYNTDSNKYNRLRLFINKFVSPLQSPLIKLKQLSVAAENNKILRERLIASEHAKKSILDYEVENFRLKQLLNFKTQINYNLVPATITNMGLSPNLSAVTINIGSDSGVSKNNPVITPNGIIGKISAVNDNSAIVHLINDSDFRISVRIMPNGSTGILRWHKNNICEVHEVYKNSIVNVGDRVVTSGLSDIFPPDLHVGNVINVVDDRSLFQKRVLVQIDDNLSSLSHVFVLIDQQIK